jgi:hypothetical protein
MPAFAHTATSSGPNTEILLLGAGMVVLAVIFFFQKTASRQASLVLGVLGVAAITGAFTLASDSGSTDHHDASIAIASPADGEAVDAGTVAVEIELTGAELAADSDSADAGHVHVYVDGGDVVMASSLTVEVELEPGEHEIEAEYVDADHRALDPPVVDSVTVTAE